MRAAGRVGEACAWLTLRSCVALCLSPILNSRHLYGTRIHACGDPLLIRRLVSMLHKMAQSPHAPPAQLVDSDRPRCCVSETTPYQWVRLASTFSLQLLQSVHSNSKRFLLLQDYRGGADGRVWLVAAESSGALGVLKFPRAHLINRQRELEKEAAVWRHVWRASATRVVTIAGEAALLMPFAFHAHRRADGSVRFLKPDHLRPNEPAAYLSDVDAAQLDTLIAAADADPQAVAKEAIRAMADKAHSHEDVHWRHVAFLVHKDASTGKLGRQAVLIDLGRVASLPTADARSKEDATAAMLAQLGTPVLSA